MRKEDIVVDGLVSTIGVNHQAGNMTLETIRYCKENGFATICGLSNISFGMPDRMHINAAFLDLAIKEGLTMAIANPCQELLVKSAFATDLLLGKENADIRYIEYVQRLEEQKTDTVKTGEQTVADPAPCLKEKYSGPVVRIVNGEKTAAAFLTVEKYSDSLHI